jgi:hypothetical protein
MVGTRHGQPLAFQETNRRQDQAGEGLVSSRHHTPNWHDTVRSTDIAGESTMRLTARNAHAAPLRGAPMTRFRSIRRLLRLASAIAVLGSAVAIAAVPADAASNFSVSLGSHGSARWTVGTSVYVNLKAMTAGTWKQQLWSGTCAQPVTRLAGLSILVVPSSRALAKTTAFTSRPASGGGVTLRLTQGSATICGAFVKPVRVASSGVLHGVDLVGMEMAWTGFSQATGPVADTNYPVIDERLIDYLAAPWGSKTPIRVRTQPDTIGRCCPSSTSSSAPSCIC